MIICDLSLSKFYHFFHQNIASTSVTSFQPKGLSLQLLTLLTEYLYQHWVHQAVREVTENTDLLRTPGGTMV